MDARRRPVAGAFYLLVLLQSQSPLGQAGAGDGLLENCRGWFVKEDTCWKRYGFVEGDCRCHKDSDAYWQRSMWICDKRKGQPIPAQLCSKQRCDGCSLPELASISSTTTSTSSSSIALQFLPQDAETRQIASSLPLESASFLLPRLAWTIAASTGCFVFVLLTLCCFRLRCNSRLDSVDVYCSGPRHKHPKAEPMGGMAAASTEEFHNVAAAREHLGALRVPQYWTNQARKGSFQSLETVDREDFEALQQMIDKTFKEIRTRDRVEAEMPVRLVLQKAYRVEHSKLWGRYAQGRETLTRKHLGGCTALAALGAAAATADAPGASELWQNINEVYLWHGTAPRKGLAIAQNGFQLSLSGSNVGCMYGPGIYLAECSSKSDEYSKSDSVGMYEDHHCLVLCRACLGEMLHMTKGGEHTHGMVKAALASESYDSVLGDREASVGTYREFVVFNEEHIYPEYLLLYARELNPAYKSGAVASSSAGVGL
eukprot:TRINITY_DN9922_c0_g1_i1.p1 TRINITY_DN9922_c0_g1~~TRINITY_DN9922_c0_g1_i1.p1  ORF type:complete len:485 (-),score=84.24 TRINITY_DN9922_c0_g1_i1:341-1795(-)